MSKFFFAGLRSAAVALGIAVTAGWSWSSTAAAAQDAKPVLNEVHVGILPIAPHLPFFAAQKLGYFAKEGIKAVPQFGAGGAALLPLLIQGQLQVGQVPISTVLQARAHNFDVVMVGPGTYIAKSAVPGQTATIVRADSPIHNLQDLSGKKVAVNVINSVNWLYNRAMLENAWVDLNKVTYVELPFPNMIDAVANGSVDAAAIVQPFLYFGLNSKKVKVLAYDFLKVQPGVQISGFTVSRKWAKANPKTLAAFERAIAHAVNYLDQHEDKARLLLAEFTHSKASVVEGAGLPSFSNHLSADNINKQMQLMIKHGLLKEKQDVTKLIWAAPYE